MRDEDATDASSITEKWSPEQAAGPGLAQVQAEGKPPPPTHTDYCRIELMRRSGVPVRRRTTKGDC